MHTTVYVILLNLETSQKGPRAEWGNELKVH